MRKHFLILMLMALLPLAGWAGDVYITPNVINVYYPDNVIPAVTANDFAISGDIPATFADAAAARASLIEAEALSITLVGSVEMPELTGSRKYYFTIADLSENETWGGTTFHVTQNGDLNVLPRPLNDVTIVITPDPDDEGYVAPANEDPAGYSYVFNAAARQPRPFVTIGAYDANVTTNRLEENTDFTYSWTFNKNVTNVPENPDDANTAGTPTITITAKEGSGYTGSTTFEFDITPKTFYNGNNLVVGISGLSEKTYDFGNAITQDFTVTDSQLGYTMIAGRDYAVVGWANNTDATATPTSTLANQASVTIKPFGNYANVDQEQEEDDTAVGRFIINPKNITDANVEFANVVKKTYDFGNEVKQIEYDPNAEAQEEGYIYLKWKYNAGTAAEPNYEYHNIHHIFTWSYANNVNVGTATLTAIINTEADGAANYTTSDPGKTTTFQILPKKLSDIENLTITIAENEAVYNEGDDVKPTIYVTVGEYNAEDLSNLLIADVDYQISNWANNTDVTPEDPEDQDKASVTIIGKGNFAAVDAQAQPITATKLFTIAKKPITITVGALATPVVYGTCEADGSDIAFTYTTNLTKVTTMEAFIEKFGGVVTYKPYTNPAEGDPVLLETAFNALDAATYKVLATWTAKSEEPYNPEAEDPGNEEDFDTQDQIDARANYSFNVNNGFGTFTISNALLVVVPQDASKIFGVVDAVNPQNENASYDYKVYASLEDAAAETNALEEVEFDVAPRYLREAGEHGGTYTISLANAPNAQPALANYTVDVNTYPTATFTINPFPVTITANPQTIIFGNNPNLNSGNTDMVQKVVNNGTEEEPVWEQVTDAYITTVTISPSMLANEDVISRVLGEDGMGLGLSLSWDKNVMGENGVYAKALKPEITNTTDYAPTFVYGTLTIKNDAPSITLARVAKAKFDTDENKAAQYIEQYHGKTVSVTFSGNFAMKAEKWYPLVLPFATSVKEISKAFGYAVVDIYDGLTAAGKIKFKLHMGDIEANQPFILKVYQDMNMDDETCKFEEVEIVNAMDENFEVKQTSGDVDFVGNYKGRTDGFRSNMYYFSSDATLNEYYKGNDTNTTYLRPLGAYFVDNATDAATKRRVISIEEPNGNTTEISAITVDGAFVEANGWYTVGGTKLESVPTEKGVYIRNGKKIVIK